MEKNWWMEEVLKSLRAIEKQGEAILGLSSQVAKLEERMRELEAGNKPPKPPVRTPIPPGRVLGDD